MVKKMPKSEDGSPVTVRWGNGEYYISLNTALTKFTLWKIDKSKGYTQYEKLATSTGSPFKLYEKIEKLEK